MKTFKIFESPLGKKEAVKVGWSWPAFWFFFIWILVKKLYFIASIIWSLLIIIIFVEIEVGTADTISSIFSFIIGIVGGIQGNKWRENNLIQRGFISKTTIQAMTPEGALALFVQQKS